MYVYGLTNHLISRLFKLGLIQDVTSSALPLTEASSPPPVPSESADDSSPAYKSPGAAPSINQTEPDETTADAESSEAAPAPPSHVDSLNQRVVDLRAFFIDLKITATEAAMYAQNLVDDGYDTVEDLLELNDSELSDYIGKKGHVKKVIKRRGTSSDG